MKRTLLLLSAAAAALLSFPASAQDENNAPRANPPESSRPDYSRERPARAGAAGERLHGAAKVSEVIGMTVKNYQGETLGTVEDLAVDLESGRVVQVILSAGGVAGVGSRLSAVPPGALHHDVANKVLHLDATKEKLQSAPEFKSGQWAEHSDAQHLSSVYTYYGQESAFKFIHKGDLDDGSANTTSTRNADGTWNKARMTGERQWMIPSTRLGQVQKASQLLGMTVKNRQDQKVGTVDNLLVDLRSGRVVAVVVSAGGFLGMGDELSAVPPTALSFSAGRDALQLDATKEQMAAAPHFKAGQWPDFNQAMYSESVYRAYKQEPYFSTNTMTGADNTGRNVRDRDERNLTPQDQGNSRTDTDLTAQIRKGINDSKDMSVNAKNVKIITAQGRVTLRGPVATAEEKRMIGEIASGLARPENVDNQLEVK